MSNDAIFPYKVLLYDDEPAYAQTIKILLEKNGFKVVVVSKWDEANAEVNSHYFDIVITDLELGGQNTGKDFLELIRKKNGHQAIIIITGDSDFLDEPIREYVNILSSGPITFCDKRVDIVIVAREVINRIDPVRRCLSIMSEMGMANREFKLGEKSYKVKELLAPNEETESLILNLREALADLMIEMIGKING